MRWRDAPAAAVLAAMTFYVGYRVGHVIVLLLWWWWTV